MSDQSFILDISSVLNSEIGGSQSFSVKYKIRDEIDEIQFADDIIGKITIEHIGKNRILAFFNLKTVLKMCCARCLKKFETPIYLNYEQEYGPKNSEVNSNDFFIMPNKTINIFPSIRQELILSVPIKPICSANCKGLVKSLKHKS